MRIQRQTVELFNCISTKFNADRENIEGEPDRCRANGLFCGEKAQILFGRRIALTEPELRWLNSADEEEQ
jgi:hypothetical protein